MNIFGLLFLALSASCALGGDVWVLKTPNGFEIDQKNPMGQNDVASLLFRLMGVTETADCSWPGLKQTNPFASSKRAIVVAVSSPDPVLSSSNTQLQSELKLPGTKVPLSSPFNPNALIYTLDHPLASAFGNKAGVEIVDQSTVPSNRSPIASSTLNASSPAVADLYDELNALRSLPSALTADSKVYIFEFSALESLKKTELPEARRLLSAALTDLAENEQAVLAVDYVPFMKARAKRQAAYADNDYTVPFHLIFWTCIILFFVTLSVSMGIAGMDPGKDSIIYRMTSTRIKKDN
jgi:renin receptor